ncbi:hypothetical protein ACGFNP_44415 [Nonomuraea sp. NPDC049269]
MGKKKRNRQHDSDDATGYSSRTTIGNGAVLDHQTTMSNRAFEARQRANTEIGKAIADSVRIDPLGGLMDTVSETMTKAFIKGAARAAAPKQIEQ